MNKKKNLLIVIIVISLVFIFLVGFFIFNRHMLKTNFENDILPFARKNQNTIFKINKITFLVVVMQKIKLHLILILQLKIYINIQILLCL